MLYFLKGRDFFFLLFNELFHYHLLDVAVISHKGPPLSRWSKGSNPVILPCLSWQFLWVGGFWRVQYV